MTHLDIRPDIEAAPWEDLKPLVESGGMIERQPCGRLVEIARIGRLPRGTARGNSTVCVVIKMPDGRTVIAETTLKLFWAAALAIRASADRAGETDEA